MVTEYSFHLAVQLHESNFIATHHNISQLCFTFQVCNEWWSRNVSCLLYIMQVKVYLRWGADSNDITDHPHDDKRRPYLCTLCDKWFRRKGHLKRHKQIHTRDTLYSCTQCEKRFTNQDYLKQHMNVHSRKYKCTECGKCFHSKQDLTVHRRIHSGEKPFECTVCSKRFTT